MLLITNIQVIIILKKNKKLARRNGIYCPSRIGAAKAICKIREGRLDAEFREIKDVKPEDLAQNDVIVVGTPTHYGHGRRGGKFVDALKKDERIKEPRPLIHYMREKMGGLNDLEKYMKKFCQGSAVLLSAGDARRSS